MPFLQDKCTFKAIDASLLAKCTAFDCGHKDLNEFFAKDCIKYSEQLLGKTYGFTLDEDPSSLVCAFTISNDSIKTRYIPTSKKNKINRKIPHLKQTRSYPAVLIGRLGVNKTFKRNGIGVELMNFIKAWFINPGNKTGCRYVVVDSYNEEIPISYYKSNGFEFLFDTEEEEKEFSGLPADVVLRTRPMYFDLIVLSVNNIKKVQKP